MPIVNPTLPNDGEDADAIDVSGPILAILAVLNGHLDGDNIEPGSLPWSVMASLNNVIPGAAMADDSNVKKYRDEANIGFVASGLVWSALTGLNGAMTAGILYAPDGSRVSITSIASRAFTASKDTYVSVSPGGTVAYQEVAVDAVSPTLATDYKWLAIVTTSGSAITAVKDIRPLTPASNMTNDGQGIPAFSVYRNAAFSIASGSTVGMQFDTKLYDNLKSYQASTGRFTAPFHGLYTFTQQIGVASMSSGQYFWVSLFKNGTEVARGNRQSGGNPNGIYPILTRTLELQAGDYVQGGYVSGQALSTEAGQNITWWEGIMACRLP